MSQVPTSADSHDDLQPFRRGLAALNELQRRGASWSGYERNCCFLNTTGQRFANVSSISGFDFVDDARAVAVVDWNTDGALDLWVTNRTAPRVRVLQNQPHAMNHWIAFRLEGTACNRDAIGARVELHVPNQPPLVATLRAGSGYLSQASKRVHMGLGQHADPIDIVVYWPDGETAKYTKLDPDATYA
ncbi:MAG: ASPIC/UnbV domain-containing protein, partial [Planctomycetales bacterium]|nr:ASPIC/UnbV domain-containing protein [Planctomycetales bacterium]